MTESRSGPAWAVRLAQIGDQLRAVASNGLACSHDPYQVERFHKILALAATITSLGDERTPEQLELLFFADLAYKTPLVGVDTAVFDREDRLLLIRRSDDGLWALPGGACDVGETPAQNAAREVREETGYVVDITHLLGIEDGRSIGARSGRHMYHLLCAAVVNHGAPATSGESVEVRWWTGAEIPWSRLSPGHERRIRFAVAWRLDPALPPYWE